MILHDRMKHPSEMGAEEVNAFLSHLVLKENVVINTQKTALNALVFLYHKFLKKDLGCLDFKPASRPKT